MIGCRAVAVLLIGAAAAPAVSRCAQAQAYPTRPVTLVVPFPAGGPLDTVARIMGERMQVSLGQSIIVENVAGASGSIALGRVARAPPDGYTFVAGGTPTQVLNGAVLTLPYDAVKDFQPIS